jgi:Replication initiator protein A
MKPEPNQPERPDLPPSPELLGKDEMNLAELPITLLTDRAPAGQRTIDRQVQAYDERTGKLIWRRVRVTGSESYGIPTAKDGLILLGLVYLTKKANDFTDRRVRFTRSELIRVLGWPDTGPYYKRIATSLYRWTNVFCLYENSWWESHRQAYATKGFGIIDDFELNDGSRSEPGGLLRSNFAWNDVFFTSLQSGFVRTLDLGVLFKLKHPTSQQMYRYLGKHFYRCRELTLDLEPFACEHVGLGRNYRDNGKIKEKLRPAIEELEAIGFLEPMTCERRYTKVGHRRWKITLRRAEGAEVADREPGGPSVAPGTSELAKDLIARGITPMAAAELARGHPEERIRAKLEVFDWLLAKKDKRVAKSPAGYLVKSIRDDYAAPQGFESEADRSRRLEAEEEQRRARAEARHQGQTQERAREEALQARITAYWDALSPDDREALRERALAQPHPLLSLYRRHRGQGTPAERRYLKLILDAHIIELLGEG